jgi:hypothetical protein
MRTRMHTVLVIIATTIVGCENEDQRLAEQAAHHTEMQATQNQEMARVNREVAAGTKRLVEADAEARRQVVTLQQDLQAERQQIAAGRDALESERQRMAAERHRDPIIAAAINGFGAILACLLPLALSGYLLHSLYAGRPEEEIGELLISDLVAESPLLFPQSEPDGQRHLVGPATDALQDDDPAPF